MLHQDLEEKGYSNLNYARTELSGMEALDKEEMLEDFAKYIKLLVNNSVERFKCITELSEEYKFVRSPFIAGELLPSSVPVHKP